MNRFGMNSSAIPRLESRGAKSNSCDFLRYEKSIKEAITENHIPNRVSKTLHWHFKLF